MPKTYSTRQSVGIARKAMISHSIEKTLEGERRVVSGGGVAVEEVVAVVVVVVEW